MSMSEAEMAFGHSISPNARDVDDHSGRAPRFARFAWSSRTHRQVSLRSRQLLAKRRPAPNPGLNLDYRGLAGRKVIGGRAWLFSNRLTVVSDMRVPQWIGLATQRGPPILV